MTPEKSSTVLITGANRGIGLEFARQYAEAGWQVVATCRNPDEASALRDSAGASEGRMRILALDVVDTPSVAAAAKAIADQPIDLLINNAGRMSGDSNRLETLDLDELAATLQTNTIGPLRVLQAFLPHLRRGDGKRAVTITSRMGSIAENRGGGWIAYRTSKAAVNQAIVSVARELAGEGIIAVVMHPGWVRTDMGGRGAPLAPADSVRAMRRAIQDLGAGDAGRFLAYDGAEIAF